MKQSWAIFLSFFCSFIFLTNKAISGPMDINASLLGDMARLEFSMQGIDQSTTLRQKNKIITITFKEKIYTNPAILTQIAPGYVKSAVLSKDLTTINIETTKVFPLNNLLLDNILFIELVGPPSTNLTDLKNSMSPSSGSYFPPLVAKNQEISDLPQAAAEKTYQAKKAELALGITNEENKTVFDFNWNKKIPYSSAKKDDGVDIVFESDTIIDKNDVSPLLDDKLKQFETTTKDNELKVFIPVPKEYKYKIAEKNTNVSVVLSKKETNTNAVQKPKKQPEQKKKTSISKNTKTIKIEQKKQPIAIKEPAVQKTEDVEEVIDFLDLAVDEPIIDKNPDIFDDTPASNGARTFSLSFPWNRDTAAALFKKQGYWWIVFDRKAEIDFTLLKKLGGDVVHEIVQLPNASATVIRMIIQSNYNPTVRKEGLLWIVDIVNRPTAPIIKLEIEPQIQDNNGAKLFIPTTGVGMPQELNDPLYGDNFTVFPVYGLGWGIPQRRTFPGLNIPKTIQGIVIEPLASDVFATSNNSGIIISRASGGLSLSSEAIISDEDEDYSVEGLDTLFHLAPIAKATQEEFIEELPNYLARASMGTKDQKNRQRIALAKFYLANGYTPEALSVLDVAIQDDFKLIDNPSFLATRAMANVLFNRPDAAIDDLNQELFENSDFAKIWIAAAYAQKNDFSPAQFSVLRKYTDAIADLPYDIKAKMAILGAKTALNQEDEATLETFIEMLLPEENNPYQQAAYDYYKGMHFDFIASFKEAGEHFEKAKNSQSQLYHTLGARELAKLQFKLDMITIDDLAKELEKLRYAWRGDDIEYTTISELIDFYIQNEKYPEALRKMDDIIEFFPNNKETDTIKTMQKKLFYDLYLNDKSASMSPITAIGLFNEFQRLVPKDKNGNEMVKKLADRLVSVDLLPSAAELLEKQMENSFLIGQQRSAIGTRLALIYLLNNEPEKVQQALDNSIQFPVSAALQEQRTLIRAKALSESGNIDAAVKLLNETNSINAQKLKVELYWADKDWENVSEEIRLLVKKPKVGQPISEEQAKTILAWATAMKLSNNETALTRLRENFITYMNDTPYYEAFNIISAPKDQKIDIKNLANEIKVAQSFASFIANYTKDLKSNNLSEIVK